MSDKPIELLQRLKSLSGPFPTWDMGQLPDRPGKLFLEWLRLAVENEVKEPHAMTISTVDQDGYPDARVLILKNVIDETFYFASSSESRKGQRVEGKFSCRSDILLAFTWKTDSDKGNCRGSGR